MAKCRNCGEEIRWTKTRNNKNLPINYDKDHDDLFENNKNVVFDRDNMTCHFETCPEGIQS